MRLFVSIRPDKKGGGSNTFSSNVADWARRHRVRLEDSIEKADVAIVIAHVGATPEGLMAARDRGCFIVHRIDEHFGGFLDEAYIRKHEYIHALNAAATVTVFQSEFVRQTAMPFLKSANHVVILNGADPACFHPGRRPGDDIGHVTWGTIPKKRLDLVHQEMLRRPDERFRLVGRHRHVTDPGISFDLPNAVLRGERSRREMPDEYRKMKVLYFPSENDPCPNTVIEAILSGVPVCYHESGGTPEVVRDCGLPLSRFGELLEHVDEYRERCLRRTDLHFDNVMERYSALWAGRVAGTE